MNFDYYQPYRKCKSRFPAASYEITLLENAQQIAKRKEEDHFRQLNHTFNWSIDKHLKAAYLKSMQLGSTLILTDVSNTILWTTYNFLSMTGYGPKEVIGQTPKMLQGPGTDPLITRYIGNSIRQAQAVQTDLVNYRKNGQAYICHLEINPLRNSKGELTHFLAKAVEQIAQ
jgi:PAS domain S-box-containing protein